MAPAYSLSSSYGICGLLSKKWIARNFSCAGKPEPGAKDYIELAPTVSYFGDYKWSWVLKSLFEFLRKKENMDFSVLHSEEGGRFDHFVNNYCLREITEPLLDIPSNPLEFFERTQGC